MPKRAIAAGLGCIVFASAASAETLILNANVPPTHFSVINGIEPLMKCVTERTNGGLDFSFFPSEQIATAKASLDAINTNLSQVSTIVTTSLSDKLPLANISVLPGMGKNTVQMMQAWRKVLADGGPMADELKANHIEVLLVHMYPPYQLGLSDRKIETLADFQGQKLRVLGGAQVFSVTSMGAVPVQMSGGDSYVGMQQGTIDGYVLALPSIDSYKLQEVTGTMTTNANFASAQTIFGMDDRFFASLSEDKRKALKDCGREVEDSLAAYQDGWVTDLQAKFAAAGVETYALSDTTLTELDKVFHLAVEDYIKRLTDLGLPAREALAQYRAALGQ